jgi:hypothetical protein
VPRKRPQNGNNNVDDRSCTTTPDSILRQPARDVFADLQA